MDQVNFILDFFIQKHIFEQKLKTGKSNLMDAISFVLGESTKNLRVKKLSVRKINRFLFCMCNQQFCIGWANLN